MTRLKRIMRMVAFDIPASSTSQGRVKHNNPHHPAVSAHPSEQLGREAGQMDSRHARVQSHHPIESVQSALVFLNLLTSRTKRLGESAARPEEICEERSRLR